ncbi:Sarcosine/dimethylglycine N-methyltransferase [BD1-7 clade bacterium]|uniref:Sarcosine/dimethylglycine N-methyltransferase n=1 Tax=BD1-7 clade bacterium TaxID=2029982 RepID=A0A5S9Q5Q2_9GAMM|nr:Sarcosine/dimethylglycine N-methyltransferase [BD1-7 clade bacterium]
MKQATRLQALSDDETAQAQIVAQYDSVDGHLFYQKVMGADADFSHFGIFQTPTDSLATSAKNSVAVMAQTADQYVSLKGTRVADLGSGYGGSARYWVAQFGCEMDCINLCPQQNARNQQANVEAGLDQQIRVTEGNLLALPDVWTATFDAVNCQDVLCHIYNKREALAQVFRILKPGGVLVFSDIMAGVRATDDMQAAFSQHNVGDIVRLKTYQTLLQDSGFEWLGFDDHSNDFGLFSQKMADTLTENRTELMAAGMSEAYLERFLHSLLQRRQLAQQQVFQWGIFCVRKPSLAAD